MLPAGKRYRTERFGDDAQLDVPIFIPEDARALAEDENDHNDGSSRGRRLWEHLGEVVQAATFVLKNAPPRGYRPVFFRLLDGGEERKRTALRLGENRFAEAAQSEFEKIPGSPIAYWVTAKVRESFVEFPAASASLDPREGLATGNNDRYVRCWPEVSIEEIGLGCEDCTAAKETGRRWFPYNKGGASEVGWQHLVLGGLVRRWRRAPNEATSIGSPGLGP